LNHPTRPPSLTAREATASYERRDGGGPVRRRRPAAELRLAIDCMPVATRRAMLEGIGSTTIIVGGYTDGDGGVCPMLAAHRNGGRTSFASFAHAWDRYTRAGRKPRRATQRELRTLRTMLETSLQLEDAGASGPMAEAIADHRSTQVHRARREEFDVEPLEPLPQYVSPARTNCTSGTKHAVEVLSR
jgi:hypothetical protein